MPPDSEHALLLSKNHGRGLLDLHSYLNILRFRGEERQRMSLNRDSNDNSVSNLTKLHVTARR